MISQLYPESISLILISFELANFHSKLVLARLDFSVAKDTIMSSIEVFKSFK